MEAACTTSRKEATIKCIGFIDFVSIWISIFDFLKVVVLFFWQEQMLTVPVDLN